jgi:acetyl esterase/lipase
MIRPLISVGETLVRGSWIAAILLFAFANDARAQTRRMRAADVDTVPVRDSGQRIVYGADSLHFGRLRLPRAGPFPVVIVVHGGCWFSPYATLRNTAPLAQAITDAGAATWNVEYRRYDNPGGGWPGTFLDVATATDFVRQLAKRYPLDTSRVVVVGHSAGAHLGLWLASRRTLPASSPLASGTALALAGVVSVGGIADLREFHARERASCGNPAVESLLGATPDSVPARVREASPIERLPLGISTVHVAGERDAIAPRTVVEAYAAAARAKGDSVEIIIVPGAGHFEAIVPYTDAGRAVIDAVMRLVRRGEVARRR